MQKPSKMKCGRVQEDAIALLGIELTDEQEQAVYSHLSSCPHCREEFRKDRKAWRAISTCPVVTADASFSRMLSLRLQLEEEGEPRPDQFDRVLPELDTTSPQPSPMRRGGEQDARYDLSRLVSIFASGMPQ